MELFAAHRQWAERPSDERFTTLGDLHSAVVKRQRECDDGKITMSDVALEVNGDILVRGKVRTAKLTHWSAGQLLSKLGVPRDLLTKLSPKVATDVVMDRLTRSLADYSMDKRQRVLVQGDTIRAFHGDRYERLWDAQVTKMLMEYLPPGWRNPVAYKGGEWGAELVPSGLYSGDRDMFAFFIDGGDAQERTAFDVDGEEFNNGFYAWNSEVGAATFGFTKMKFRRICGNNIIWGASDIHTFSGVHRGGAHKVLKGLRKYLEVLNEQPSDDQFVQAVRAAKLEIASKIGGNRTENVEEALRKFKGKGFTQAQIVGALDAVVREEKGVIGSRWDWLQGFTAVARTQPNADDRSDMEVKASRLLLATR